MQSMLGRGTMLYSCNSLIILIIIRSISSLAWKDLDILDCDNKNFSEVSLGLAKVIRGIHPLQLAILVRTPEAVGRFDYESNSDIQDLQKHLNHFVQQLHKFHIKSVIYDNATLFFQYIGDSLLGSIESVNLMFSQPNKQLIGRIYEEKLAHRLSLFIFYWGSSRLPKYEASQFPEPLRAIVITRPRKNAFRIYYNQAEPNGKGNLKLVSWYDGDNLGLSTDPLLPPASSVYSDFRGREFRVPVFHSPPWFWVNYENESRTTNGTIDYNDVYYDNDNDDNDDMNDIKEVHVIGGRDHRLLQLLADHMNFQFIYIEAPGRTQGTLRSDNESTNEIFTGGIGLLQNGLADLFLGDVSLSWERRKAIEFTFFTLADSGAFATHAPRPLNEALALIRPFKLNVWPYLIVTVLLSGPIFYLNIITPYKWRLKRAEKAVAAVTALKVDDKEKLGRFYLTYIKEITPIDRRRRPNHTNRMANIFNKSSMDRDDNYNHNHNDGIDDNDDDDDNNLKMPNNLFDKCLWFTVQLFLKQSFKEFYHGYRAKFLTILYCIVGTYVLADVYSAQLTSQFARPAHEPPINTLQQLQRAMIQDGYQLFVEKESSSLEMLENGTEIFRQLYGLMKSQNPQGDGYLIDSVESGIQLIADGQENKAILGGRETLYFNLKPHGLKRFQLSHKLYTRYSAVAVQIGCPYLDSLNNVLIHLFEGGILDKMTIAEYEMQSRLINANSTRNTTKSREVVGNDSSGIENDDKNREINGLNPDNNNEEAVTASGMKKTSDVGTPSSGVLTPPSMTIIRPLNLRMLQGAFIVLMVGYGIAGLILLLELVFYKKNRKRFQAAETVRRSVEQKVKYWRKKFWQILRGLSMRLFIQYE